MNQLNIQRVLACVFFLVAALEIKQCSGFAGSSAMPCKATTTRLQQSSLQMYAPQQSSAQSSSNNKKASSSQQMIPNQVSIAPTRGNEQQDKPSSSSRFNTELSNSVLAEGSTLPSFPTAHGLLSPETVMRMEEMVEMEGHSSGAVDQFLTRYRRSGPMSCLSMLSDPAVLPHLTKAMRDIA